MNPILEKYIPIASLIVDTFGKHCEVVIHDFSMPKSSIVYILNNVVTNREVGGTFTDDFVKQVLISQKFHDDCAANYLMTGKDGKKIKSSTALIRDASDKVVGALCVNIDLDFITTAMSNIAELVGIPEIISPSTNGEVDVISNIKEIVDDIIDKTIADTNVDELTKEEKIDLISFMYDKGMFTIKGAVDKVAERMNISRVTVYSYLDEIKKSRT